MSGKGVGSGKGLTYDEQGPLPPGWKTRIDPVKVRKSANANAPRTGGHPVFATRHARQRQRRGTSRVRLGHGRSAWEAGAGTGRVPIHGPTEEEVPSQSANAEDFPSPCICSVSVAAWPGLAWLRPSSLRCLPLSPWFVLVVLRGAHCDDHDRCGGRNGDATTTARRSRRNGTARRRRARLQGLRRRNRQRVPRVRLGRKRPARTHPRGT